MLILRCQNPFTKQKFSNFNRKKSLSRNLIQTTNPTISLHLSFDYALAHQLNSFQNNHQFHRDKISRNHIFFLSELSVIICHWNF